MSGPRDKTRIVRVAVRSILVVTALLWLAFALASGAGQSGGGLTGIVRNWPNALPWLVLGFAVAIAMRWERIGGALVIAIGLGFAAFFQAWRFPVVLFGVCIPLIVLGMALVTLSVRAPLRR